MMKDSKEEALWAEVHVAAAELEAFEPHLAGWVKELTNLESGQPFPAVWISKAAPYLQSEAVYELALKLNQAAGLCYSQKDYSRARAICQGALVLSTISTGSDHPATMQIAGNLQKLDKLLQPPKLPKLRKFKAP